MGDIKTSFFDYKRTNTTVLFLVFYVARKAGDVSGRPDTATSVASPAVDGKQTATSRRLFSERTI